MKSGLRRLAAVGALLWALSVGGMAFAQKSGGILKIYALDSPASISIHEEAAPQAVVPMMGVFNNLVMFDQHVPENSLQSIVPDLALRWSWNEVGTELKFPLRQGVHWHDGEPFTAGDVKCTWDLLTGKSSDKLRLDPQIVVQQPRGGDHERRLGGHLSSETAAAFVHRAVGVGLVAGLPLPYCAARHARSSNRHRPFQIR